MIYHLSKMSHNTIVNMEQYTQFKLKLMTIINKEMEMLNPSVTPVSIHLQILKKIVNEKDIDISTPYGNDAKFYLNINGNKYTITDFENIDNFNIQELKKQYTGISVYIQVDINDIDTKVIKLDCNFRFNKDKCFSI
jgi:hypothetical protein